MDRKEELEKILFKLVRDIALTDSEKEIIEEIVSKNLDFE